MAGSEAKDGGARGWQGLAKGVATECAHVGFAAVLGDNKYKKLLDIPVECSGKVGVQVEEKERAIYASMASPASPFQRFQ